MLDVYSLDSSSGFRHLLGRFGLAIFALACLSFGNPSDSQAALIVYDGLRTADGYSNGGTVQSQTGLTGPSGWTTGAWGGTGTGHTYQDSAGLTYSTAGYAGGGGLQHLTATDNTRSVSRTLSPAFTLPNTANLDVYMSFMLNVGSADATGSAYAQFSTGAATARGLGAGVNNGNLAVVARNGATFTLTNILDNSSAPIAYTAGQTYYFVLKLSSGSDSWTGTDALEVWVNPTNVSSEGLMTSTALAHNLFSNTYSNGVASDSLSLNVTVTNMSNNTIKFDEFRLATDLASAAVPEPGAAGLLATGISLLIARRRQRRITR